MNENWETIIGLEVHAQLSSKTKLFSNSLNSFGAQPNSHVSYVDMAMPGTLPVINEKCIELAVKAGLALNGSVNKLSRFDRKNYFYPDLPQGYQITQFFAPIIQNASLEIKDSKTGNLRKINIEKIHIEQDAGKSLHDQSLTDTFIDLNRAGVPLIEIITAPDFRDHKEVDEFMRKLRNLLRYIDVCDGNFEQGNIRCDVNISLRKEGEKKLGIRTETKNLNSFKSITKAIIHEVSRQKSILNSGGDIIQETRLYDFATDTAKAMRTKEDDSDYRYFPDPDLLSIRLSDSIIESIKSELPELPEQKMKRYIKLGLTEQEAAVLLDNKSVASFFEKISQDIPSKLAANWICIELFGRLNKKDIPFSSCPISTENFTKLLAMVRDDRISGKIAKDILDKMFETMEDPELIIESCNLSQISDDAKIKEYVDHVLKENPKMVEQYKNGKEKLFGFFTGQIMKLSNGRANPIILKKILKSKLENDN